MLNNKSLIVHCKKDKYDVYIGRPSKWANPFYWKEGSLAKYVVSSREEAISKYKEWILTQPELLKDLGELEGKTLGCWCNYPAQDCHGRILLEMAKIEDDKRAARLEASMAILEARYDPANED